MKKETLTQVFSCEFCEVSKTPFLQDTSGRLLLNSDIEKFILIAASEGEFILGTFLHGCFSKAAADASEISF